MEAVIALVLLAFGAVAAAAAEAWAARACALAELREDGAAAAELVLDSLAQAPTPSSGSTTVDGLDVAWELVPRGTLAEVRLRVTGRGGPTPAGAVREVFTALVGPPPALLEPSP